MSAVNLPTWEDYSPGDPDVCVWCHVTGCADATAVHLPVCPSVTGLWPAMPHHVARRTCCAVCDHLFVLGDLSAEVPDPADAQWSLTVCAPCSLLRRDEAERLIPEVKPR